MIETQFIAFFAVLIVAVFFSSAFSKIHIPWAVALIIGGMIVGPGLLNWFSPNDTITFLGEIGAVFLMFMAGLEIRFQSFKREFSSIGFIAAINGMVPFACGVVIILMFGFSLNVALLVGIVFISSSVAVVIPTLDKNKLLGEPIGSAIVGSTVLQDISSLVLVSIFLQTSSTITWLPLPVFYILLVIFIFILYKIVSFLRKWIIKEGSFHQEFQFLLAVLTGVVVIFSLLGLHHIVAGFFTGLVLAEPLRNNKIKESMHTVGYGIFIPVFFILVGTNTDLSVFASYKEILPLTIALVVGLIGSKFLSGYFAARFKKFSKHNSLLIAATSVPQLATTLAVAYTAFSMGIISADLVTAFVILSIITTIGSPLVTRKILGNK